jgi:hypothetical protein
MRLHPAVIDGRVCHNSVILDFCVAREGLPSPLFRFEKSPRGQITALFECLVAFFIIFIAVCRGGHPNLPRS